jgi:two-component system, cell cycle response regulator DivK
MSRPTGGRAARSKRRAPKVGALNATILIADDSAESREMYAAYLAFRGFRVVQAADGEQALRKALSSSPDVLVLDIAMPGIDGMEVCRRLRADPRTHKTPVIALTGHAFKAWEHAARAAGCDSYLAKPCLPEELLGEIRKLLRPSRRSR